MKFNINLNKTALYTAVENEEIEIIESLLTNEQIDVNVLNVLQYFYIKFKRRDFNDISKIK